jgi:hypothetical protein
MNNEIVIARIHQLSLGEYQPEGFLQDLYGLTQEGFHNALSSVGSFASKFLDLDFQHDDLFSRWALESFFVRFDLLPPRLAAYRLGVSLDSMSAIRDFAQTELALPTSVFMDPKFAYDANLVNHFYQYFPSLRMTLFSNHTSQCKAIHRELRKAGVSFTPVYDELSLKINPKSPDAPYAIDVATLQPLGLRNTVWLGLKKPIRLEPDKTSILTYIRFEAELQPILSSFHKPDLEKIDDIKKILS